MRNQNRVYQNYFDNEVLSATPMELIGMLYDAALDAIAAARRHIRSQDIRARVRSINKGLRILTELMRCLNYQAGGDLSRSLAALYRYVMRLLVDANARQTEAPLAEAEKLLATLAAGWKACRAGVAEGGDARDPHHQLIAPDVYVADSAPQSPPAGTY